MTSEDRLNHIENYLRFIDTIYDEEGIADSEIPLSALGFSQGAATVCRWVSRPEVEFDRLILWAGLFPPDMNWEISRDKFQEKEISFVYGLDDPYINDERFHEQREFAKRLEVDPKIITFRGGHNLDTSTLEKLFS